jgi:hypothetical protein
MIDARVGVQTGAAVWKFVMMTLSLAIFSSSGVFMPCPTNGGTDRSPYPEEEKRH